MGQKVKNILFLFLGTFFANYFFCQNLDLVSENQDISIGIDNANKAENNKIFWQNLIPDFSEPEKTLPRNAFYDAPFYSPDWHILEILIMLVFLLIPFCIIHISLFVFFTDISEGQAIISSIVGNIGSALFLFIFLLLGKEMGLLDLLDRKFIFDRGRAYDIVVFLIIFFSSFILEFLILRFYYSIKFNITRLLVLLFSNLITLLLLIYLFLLYLPKRPY